jgi:hypothetical protein
MLGPDGQPTSLDNLLAYAKMVEKQAAEYAIQSALDAKKATDKA